MISSVSLWHCVSTKIEYLSLCFFLSVSATEAATKGGLLKRFSQRFCKFHGKTPALESLFNKVADLKVCNFIKKETPPQLFSCRYHKIFKNSF